MSNMYEGFDVIQQCKEGDFSSVSEHVPELIEDLINFSFEGVVIGASALAAIAENHTHILRLDCLIHLAAVHAKGAQTPTALDFERWLNRQLRNSPIFQLEDPPEDFAIGNVCTALGNRRVFNGDASHSDYYLQDLLDALQAAPSRFNLLREQCGAVLLLSDRLADRHGYSRNTSGDAGGSENVSIPASCDILEWAERSLFTPGALASGGIEVSLLRPFIRSTGDLREVASHERVMRPRRFPLLRVGDSLLIAFPTSIAMAVTEHVLEAVSEQGMLRSLHRALMRVQQERALRPTTLSLEDGASERGKLPTRYTPPSEYVTEGAFRFDVTKHLHIIFLHDDLASVLRDGIDAVWKPKFGLDLARHIEQSAHALAREAGYSGGLTLLVIGGIWRGFEIASAHNLPVNWSLQAWSSADLDYLVATESKWKLMLWKCSMLRKQLESMSVTFVGVHSDAHLFSYWRNLGFRLLPEGGPPELPLGVGIGVSEILSLRGDGRRRLMSIAFCDPTRGSG